MESMQKKREKFPKIPGVHGKRRMEIQGGSTLNKIDILNTRVTITLTC